MENKENDIKYYNDSLEEIVRNKSKATRMVLGERQRENESVILGGTKMHKEGMSNNQHKNSDHNNNNEGMSNNSNNNPNNNITNNSNNNHNNHNNNSNIIPIITNNIPSNQTFFKLSNDFSKPYDLSHDEISLDVLYKQIDDINSEIINGFNSNDVEIKDIDDVYITKELIKRGKRKEEDKNNKNNSKSGDDVESSRKRVESIIGDDDIVSIKSEINYDNICVDSLGDLYSLINYSMDQTDEIKLRVMNIIQQNNNLLKETNNHIKNTHTNQNNLNNNLNTQTNLNNNLNTHSNIHSNLNNILPSSSDDDDLVSHYKNELFLQSLLISNMENDFNEKLERMHNECIEMIERVENKQSKYIKEYKERMEKRVRKHIEEWRNKIEREVNKGE